MMAGLLVVVTATSRPTFVVIGINTKCVQTWDPANLCRHLGEGFLWSVRWFDSAADGCCCVLLRTRSSPQTRKYKYKPSCELFGLFGKGVIYRVKHREYIQYYIRLPFSKEFIQVMSKFFTRDAFHFASNPRSSDPRVGFLRRFPTNHISLTHSSHLSRDQNLRLYRPSKLISHPQSFHIIELYV